MKRTQIIQQEIIDKEKINSKEHYLPNFIKSNKNYFSDFEILLQRNTSPVMQIQTMEDLLKRDEQREKDGFPKKIRMDKIAKPGKNGKVVIIPNVFEEKFYHGQPQNEDGMGGSGEGEEGDVIGEKPLDQHGEEGESGEGGDGDGSEHELESSTYELGKILTEKFELPHLKDKGTKPSLTKFKYDLTDINSRTGQFLDKKRTLRKIIETNLGLKRINPKGKIDPNKLIVDPKDKIYRVLSREVEYESQALVFFLRDYSGSMQGKPTDVIVNQHLMIYAWLTYQYQKNVKTRFIVHDTEAKEVENFHKYYTISTAGGTQVSSAFKLVNKIVEEENLTRDYNIYVFHGTDGDDWDQTGKETIKEVGNMLAYSNRIGITIAQNTGGTKIGDTFVEQYFKKSGLLEQEKNHLRLYSMMADTANEEEIIKGLKQIISE
ncbi:MAG TPA: DUF444 family protein [Candidatus Nanoarchaeia archaeon]|nr:DUF444 family protein [Candidatus Nanoarchaeia archaeon]